MPAESENQELIAFIAPNQIVADSFTEALHDLIMEGKALVYIINMGDLRGEVQRLRSRGVSALVARGGTYFDLLALSDEIPLVRTCIGTLDVLLALQQAQKRAPGEKVYLLLNRRSEFYEEVCRSAISLPFEYIPFDTMQELQEKIEKYSAQTSGIFVGSGLTSEFSTVPPHRFVNIVMRKDTIRSSYQQALTLATHLRREVNHLRQIRATLSQIDEGVLVLNGLGTIGDTNQLAQDALQLSEEEVLQKNILSVLPNFPFQSLLGKKIPERRHKVVKIKGVMVDITISSYLAYQTQMRYLITLQKVSNIQRLEQSIRYDLAKRGLVAKFHLENILTQTPAMQHVIEQAHTVAAFSGPVLFFGESGTGKEMFAQGIHNCSTRSEEPFVAVNCAALSESLLESELFGYVGGAFTGARKEGKAGLFELAHGGTIFLDEINSMSPNLQSKLLRVLEDRSVMRIGSDYVIPLNVRVLSAANKDLWQAVQSGAFRSDLYYRLNTFELRIPPLRDRKADVELLFRHYVAEGKNLPESEIRLSEAFRAQLLAHSWPGNVRELRSTAMRYVSFEGDNSGGEILRPLSLQEPGGALTTPQGCIDLDALTHTVERLVIESLLDRNLKKSEVARMLGISRQALYKKMNAWETNPDETERAL